MGKKKQTQYSLNLRRFDLSKVKDDAVCVFIGRRRSGKSFCIRDLLHINNDIPYGVAISGSEQASPFFSDFIPKTYIFNDFEESIVDGVTTRQKKRIKQDKKSGQERDNRCFLIIDDCMHDASWAKTKGMKNVFMNGRHYKFFFILGMQYMLGLGPEMRTNIDYTFIFREPIRNNRERLYKNYAGMFPDFGSFCQVMDSLNKYECLVIDNNSETQALEDQVFWYKAKDHPPFQMGCKAYWDFHYKNYKPDEEDEEDREQNISEYRARSKLSLTVTKGQ